MAAGEKNTGEEVSGGGVELEEARVGADDAGKLSSLAKARQSL